MALESDDTGGETTPIPLDAAGICGRQRYWDPVPPSWCCM